MRIGFIAVALAVLGCRPGIEPCPPRSVLIGADLSSLPSLTELVLKRDGLSTDVWSEVEEGCIGLVRLRLWHQPSSASGSLNEVAVMAATAREHGALVLLDLHLSDTWADPGQQSPPTAWLGLPDSVLHDSVAAYVARCVAVIDPDAIQLGNETNQGWLWPAGNRWSNPSGWVATMSTAVQAARIANPDMPVWLHFAGYREVEAYAEEAKSFGVDGVGLSYYPWWHGTDLDSLGAALDLIQSQGLQSAIFEFMAPWTGSWNDNTHNLVGPNTLLVPGYAATPQGQADFVRDIRILAGSHGAWATIYWEPFWLSGSSPVENCAWADFDGFVLPSAKVR